MTHQRLFLAGFQKCGTTSLHEILNQHPEVRAGAEGNWPGETWRCKEPHFFNREWERGQEWYDSLFEPGGRVRIDSTPNTLIHGEGETVARIRNLFPAARFVALMRDPVARAYSAWNHWRGLPVDGRWPMLADSENFGRSIRMQLESDDPNEGARSFVTMGYYLRHLRRFEKIFPRGQLLPVFMDELFDDFDATMRQVAEFSGLEGFNWQSRRSHVRNPMGWLPDRATANLLRELYRPHDEALAEWLGRELPWVTKTRPAVPLAHRVFKVSRAEAPPASQRICLVLPALTASSDNEQHACTVAAMARQLAERGHKPFVLVGRNRKEFPPDLVEAHLKGLEFDLLPPWSRVMELGAPPWTVQSVAILNRLRHEQWDSLVLPAAEGTGHATLQWLQQGHHLYPCRASVYLAGRAPMVVGRERLGGFQDHPTLMQRDWLERRCLELADDLLMTDFEAYQQCVRMGWKLEKRVCFHELVTDADQAGASEVARQNTGGEGFHGWLESFAAFGAPDRWRVEGIRGQAPLVSVCMASYNRATELLQTLEALRAQTWPNLEVVLVNDGSSDPQVLELHQRLRGDFARENWLWIDQENTGAAAARNHAASRARGDFLLFADDDNLPLPHHIMALMTTLLAGGHDVALAHMVKFSTPSPPESLDQGDQWWMPVAGDVCYGVFGNCYGETSMLMSRQTFLEIGGFLPDPGPGRVHEEDRLLLTQAHLKGLSVAQCPQPTYWYRDAPGARHELFDRHDWSCRAAAVEMYSKEIHPDLRGLFEFAVSQWDHVRNDLVAWQQEPLQSPIVKKKLERLEKEAFQWRELALNLAAEGGRVLKSRRWRMANLLRMKRSMEETFPTLARLIRKVETRQAESSRGLRR